MNASYLHERRLWRHERVDEVEVGIGLHQHGHGGVGLGSQRTRDPGQEEGGVTLCAGQVHGEGRQRGARFSEECRFANTDRRRAGSRPVRNRGEDGERDTLIMESMSSGAHLCNIGHGASQQGGCGRPGLMYAPLASGCMTVGRTSRASAGGMPASSSTSSTLSSLHGGGHSGSTGGRVCGVSWLLRA